MEIEIRDFIYMFSGCCGRQGEKSLIKYSQGTPKLSLMREGIFNPPPKMICSIFYIEKPKYIFIRFSKESMTRLLESIQLNKGNNIDNHNICRPCLVELLYSGKTQVSVDE